MLKFNLRDFCNFQCFFSIFRFWQIQNAASFDHYWISAGHSIRQSTQFESKPIYSPILKKYSDERIYLGLTSNWHTSNGNASSWHTSNGLTYFEWTYFECTYFELAFFESTYIRWTYLKTYFKMTYIVKKYFEQNNFIELISNEKVNSSEKFSSSNQLASNKLSSYLCISHFEWKSSRLTLFDCTNLDWSKFRQKGILKNAPKLF